jgi:hypothetical protein
MIENNNVWIENLKFMVWYDVIYNILIWYVRYDTAWYMIWYDMIWYNMVWYMIWSFVNCSWVDSLYSSPVHIYKKTIHRTTQWDRLPRAEHTTLRMLKLTKEYDMI